MASPVSIGTASLGVQSGFTLGLDTGTQTIMTGLDGWYGSSKLRRNKTDRTGQHGSHSERGYKEERLVTLRGHFFGSSRGEAAREAERLAAFLGDGTDGLLTIEDADLGPRWTNVYLVDDGVDIKWTGGDNFPFVIRMLAPDARKYGTKLILPATGIQAPGGGLVFPLFSRGILSSTVTRTNYALNPSLEVDTTDWLGNSATIGRTTAEFHNGIASLSVLTNGAVGSGAYKDAKAIAGSGWAVGDPCSASIWFKAPSGTAMKAQLVCLGGATGSPSVTPTATGAWQQVTMVNGVMPSGATSVPYIFLSVNVTHTALTFYADEAIIEKSSTPGTYFDGSSTFTPVDADTSRSYAWTGTANASTSQETTIEYAGAAGVLDFGTGGSTGQVSLTNTGTAPAYPVFRVTADSAPSGFSITETTTSRRLVYSGVLVAGQELVIVSGDGSATLNGTAPRESELSVAQFTPVPPGSSSTWLFEATNSVNALLVVEVTPAWW